MSENPYTPPDASDMESSRSPAGLTSWKTVRFIIAVGLVGSLLGTVIGWLLAVIAPEHFQQLFNRTGDPAFRPIAMGLGLGMAQGFGAGVGLGTLLAVVQAWLDVRRQQQA